MTRNLPAYRQMAAMMVQIVFTYRFNAAMELVSLLLQVYLLRVVWTAVYAGRGEVQGLPLHEIVAYLTLATLQMTAMYPTVAYYVQERVDEGSVGLDLARPAPFLGQMLARQVGDTAGALPFLVVGFPFAALIGGAQPPASLAGGALYLASMILAYAVAVLVGLLIGLLAFWTVQVHAFLQIYRFVSHFFGGALIPLWFFPDWLTAVAAALPFQTQAHLPLAIYFGRIGPADAAGPLALQAAWVVGLYALAHVGWRRAIRRVVVQGG